VTDPLEEGPDVQPTFGERFLSLPGLRAVAATVATALFGGSLAVLAGATAWIYRDYWALAVASREAHELHHLLNPGGPGGLWLGVIGTALMLAMLLYTVRKKLSAVRWLGSLPGWLRFHMICGVMGPLLIVLHGGLKWPTGLIAVGFWCMVAVALSGLFGRYVYGFFPRNAAGTALDLGLAAEALSDLRARLVEQTRDASGDQIGEAVKLAREVEIEGRQPIHLLRLDLEVRRRSRRIRRILTATDLPAATQRDAARDLVAQLRLRRSMEA